MYIETNWWDGPPDEMDEEEAHIVELLRALEKTYGKRTTDPDPDPDAGADAGDRAGASGGEDQAGPRDHRHDP